MHSSPAVETNITIHPNTGYCIYVPHSLHLLRRLSCKQWVASPPGAHRLIVFQADQGVLHLRNHFVQADKNHAFLLAPGAEASIQFTRIPDDRNDVAAIVIEFSVYLLGQMMPTNELLSVIPYETCIDIGDESRFLDLAEALNVSLDNTDVSRAPEEALLLKQQIVMQELILFLIENVQRNKETSDSLQAVKHTVAYIETHYQLNITARQLYSIAGVAKWQYSTLFQSITGKKPLDYLLDIRLKHAKRLLLHTNDTLAQIAKAVGFRDENYFARKFKQSVGMTPRQYGEVAGGKASPNVSDPSPYKRIVAIGYCLGDLLSLGVTPVGADVEIIGKRSLYRDAQEGVQDIGLLGEPAKVRKLQPDLIIHSGFRQDWIDELARIAPTVMIDRYEPVYSRIMQTAELLNRQEIAEKWINGHRVASQRMWQSLASHYDVRQTAVIFSFVEGNLYVMGMKGFAVTVYHPEGLQPAPKVKELIGAGIPFQLTPLESAFTYEADIHFILMDNHPRTNLHYAKLMSGPYWNTRTNGRVIVSENKYNFDDPLTMDKLLLELPQLMMKASRSRTSALNET